MAQNGLEASLRLSHTFEQVKESVERFKSNAENQIVIGDFSSDLVEELKENILFNNEDFQGTV